MYIATLLWIVALHGPQPTPLAQELPAYFVKITQERTLFSNNEAVMLTLRLGNQIEGHIKARKLPDILAGLQVFQSDVPLKRNQKHTTKALYKKLSSIGYGAHKDFRLNLRKYYPAMSKGGIFKIVYQDANYNLEADSVSILNIPMPDLKKNYKIDTSMGNITLGVDEIQTPSHARNFALLVATQFYKDMVFHRVERGYVIQTGCPLRDGSSGSGFPLALEKSPFLRHGKYALGMARKQEPNSADSQFYICLEESKPLDEGYTVFGKVVAGFDVVDSIGNVRTSGPNSKPANRPLTDVELFSITAISREVP